MDDSSVTRLREQVVALCRGVEEVVSGTENFPALTCNMDRVKASLKMVAIDLGMTTVDSQGDR